MPEIITLGETMAALTPKETGYLHYVRDYGMRIAGAESNLAIGLCKLGHSTAWISSLGADELGYFVNNSIRAEGVDTRYVKFDPQHRTGLMLKQVLPGKETSVFYYRENSAAANMQAQELREEMFAGGKILHLTGITPVLSDSCREAVFKAIEFAKKAGLKISFDPNIRKKLWKDTDFTLVLKEIVQCSNILMLGLSEAQVLYGSSEKEEIVKAFFENEAAEYLAVKDGKNGAYVADRQGGHTILPHPCKPVDPIGAGDAFNAGFLCGLLEQRTVQEAGKIAAVAGAMATESLGDIEGYPSRVSIQHILDEKDTEIYR